MSALTQTSLTAAAVVMAAMLALWLISLRVRDAGIIDPFWGCGFVLVSVVACAINWPPSNRAWLVTGLTTVWGVRLSVYLWRRNRGHGEDRRYAAMRDRHGPRFAWVSLFTVFLLQGVILWFVSLPIQACAAQREQSPPGWLDLGGTMLWAVGLVFETVGDWQLARFRSNPANAGRVLDQGLWRYTRHPNYFGDCCVWWGLYLVAAAGGAVWTIASPVLMTVLLIRVSGVSLLESTIAQRRPAYAAYRRRTNAFFPGPPRRP